jgi:hypothetical protein
MNATEYFGLKVKKAKDFGFPEPIFINAEKLSNRTRVIYSVEIQAMHIPDKAQGTVHHYQLKFCKFKKVTEEPFWSEENVTTEEGFAIYDKASIEKIAAYIQANQALLGIDILSTDYTKAYFTNDKTAVKVLEGIMESGADRTSIFNFFKEQYPELDKKILTYKLVQARKSSLEEFRVSLSDPNKIEINYWQPFLEKNRWMFGLSYLVPLEEMRIDLWTEADYLFKSEDGFVDIVEIKHPHLPFWQKDRNSNYSRYRGYLQPGGDLKGAMTQAINYIFQIEKKFNDTDWLRENDCEAPVKPTCTVVLGRSNDWKVEENTAFRLLNDSLHGISIITFDHLYDRAKRLLDILENETE